MTVYTATLSKALSALFSEYCFYHKSSPVALRRGGLFYVAAVKND